MGFVLMLHSIIRWAIVVVAVVASARFAMGWLRKLPYSKMDRGLASGFSGLMDLQALLGLIYFIWLGLATRDWPMYRIEHLITMLVAVVVGHLPLRWKSAPDEVRFRNTLFCILGALVLVFLGVASLPGGWSR